MNYISYFENRNLSEYQDILISPECLSRLGKDKNEDVQKMVKEVKALNKRPILEWDILMTESDFDKIFSSFVLPIINQFDVVRVQDTGALKYLMENFPDKKIQLLLEGHDHNLIGIKKWEEIVGDKLDRLVLSLQLTKKSLEIYCKELNTPVEIMILGRIPLFYSPRPLANPLFEKKTEKLIGDSYMEYLASSEESAHKNLPVIENMHGTFMFNSKDHCLLECLDEVKNVGVTWARVDNRFVKNESIKKKVNDCIKEYSKDKAQKIKEQYPVGLIRGFFSVNKSDVLFKKLKNYRNIRKDHNYLGDVLDVTKGHFIGIQSKAKLNFFKNGRLELLFSTPEGKSKQVFVKEVFNSKKDKIESISPGDIFFIKHISGVSIRTRVYTISS